MARREITFDSNSWFEQSNSTAQSDLLIELTFKVFGIGFDDAGEADGLSPISWLIIVHNFVKRSSPNH
jgi:hypothetical protein